MMTPRPRPEAPELPGAALVGAALLGEGEISETDGAPTLMTLTTMAPKLAESAATSAVCRPDANVVEFRIVAPSEAAADTDAKVMVVEICRESPRRREPKTVVFCVESTTFVMFTWLALRLSVVATAAAKELRVVAFAKLVEEGTLLSESVSRTIGCCAGIGDEVTVGEGGVGEARGAGDDEGDGPATQDTAAALHTKPAAQGQPVWLTAVEVRLKAAAVELAASAAHEVQGAEPVAL